MSRVLILGLALGAVMSTTVRAQSDVKAPGERKLPLCAAANCQEETIVVTALDAILRTSRECQAAPPWVLRTLHMAPYSTHQGGRRHGLPSSPVVMRMEDLGLSPFRRYWDQVRIVDSTEVLGGAVPPDACMLIFSPVTWLGPAATRVVVGESRKQPHHHAQRFIFLELREGVWTVTRVETGWQS